MLIFRWQASTPPSQEQIKAILRAEGLEPIEEVFTREQKHTEKRHPFGEIRIVAKGELILNVAGTQLLLRAGDRIDIPANTRHSYSSQNESVVTYFSHRPF